MPPLLWGAGNAPENGLTWLERYARNDFASAVSRRRQWNLRASVGSTVSPRTSWSGSWRTRTWIGPISGASAAVASARAAIQAAPPRAGRARARCVVAAPDRSVEVTGHQATARLMA